MVIQISTRLLYLCDTIPTKLKAISEAEFYHKPTPDKWSKKEVMGHLIDSAANNLQRFIRGQYEESPVIFYDQNQWVNLQDYQAEDSAAIITLWEVNNRHLARVIAKIPESSLSRMCIGKDGKPLTLAFLIQDYLTHLEHHLDQIFTL